MFQAIPIVKILPNIFNTDNTIRFAKVFKIQCFSIAFVVLIQKIRRINMIDPQITFREFERIITIQKKLLICKNLNISNRVI